MKSTNLLWIIAIIALLAVAGCGGKDKQKLPSETVTVEGQGANDTASDNESEEPQSVIDEEGVKDTASDVTGTVKENASMVNETEEGSTVVVDTSEEDGGNTSSDSNETSSDTKTAKTYRIVSLKDLKAYPEEMTIKVGTTVEWRNVNDNLLHIIGWKGQKQSGVTPEPILAGESWSYTFKEPGKISWFSTARPTIQGIIYVEE